MIQKLSFLLIVFMLTACQQVIEQTSLEPPEAPEAPPSYEADEQAFAADLPLERVTMPEGFQISLFAGNVEGARSMSLSENGTLFVGTRGEGVVYALKDLDGNGKADRMWTIDSGLNSPNGVALKDGDLYVAEISRILKYTDIENQLDSPPEPEVVYDGYPKDTHHGWKFIRFGPDGALYVPVGAPCNICLREDPVYASITRLDTSTLEMDIIASGIRNTVGFDWHPETGELWFTDNGADWLGNEQPADELNRLRTDGDHFGFPYCHQGDMPDAAIGQSNRCGEFTPPEQQLGPHVAALGMRFYRGDQFPEEYSQQIFIAEHGSWNRTPKSGYRVTLAKEQDTGTSYETFAKGWLNDGGVHWGRPVDIEFMPDGSMLVSDDFAGAIYRITYQNPARDR